MRPSRETGTTEGGTPELLAAKYDITARIAGAAPIGKDLPQLMQTRLGPDLTPSKSDCSNPDEIAARQGAALAKGDVASFVGKPAPCSVSTDPSGGPLNLMMRGDGQETKQFVEMLSQLTGRTVRDKTGLTGRYDFAMKMDLQMVLALARRTGAPVPPSARCIRSARRGA